MNYAFYEGFTKLYMEQGIEATASFAKEHHYSSVEMFKDAVGYKTHSAPENPAEVKVVKKVLDAAGLPVACYSVYADARLPETKQRLMEQAEIVAELECPFLHHTLLPYLDVTDNSDYPEAIKIALDVAIAVANRAEELGITCIYEDQGFYVNGVEGFGGFFKIMKETCKNVGVCMDFGNILFADEKPEAFLDAYRADVRHVHVKDYLRKKAPAAPGVYWLRAAGGNWLRDTIIGDGVIDFAAGMKILNEIGYRGAFALENGHPEPFEVGIRQAMDCLTPLYDPK